MVTIKCEIEGVCAMLFKRLTEEIAEGIVTGVNKKYTEKERKKFAENHVYKKTPRSNIGVPALNLKKCLLEGCISSGVKCGRKSATQYVRATVFIDPDFLDLGQKKPDGIHAATVRIPPRTGARVMGYWPYVDAGWKLNFHFNLFDERITPELLKVALTEAGTIKGLCDHRPEYGRFKINRFDLEE